MPRASEPRLPPRDRILLAAEELFYQEGIVRVTVDAIAEKAQSTKMTLYRHFESKEVLVWEWIGLLIEDYSHVSDQLAKSHADNAAEQIKGFVRFVIDNLSGTSRRGCPFTNTLAEIGDQYADVRALIIGHKQRQYQRLEALCSGAGANAPEMLAKEITLILEGIQVVAQNGSFEKASEFTLEIIEAKLANLK
ncbi:TetR/AcrR family transcriptional regulator [Erwiniaceae bacterium BAC15a-03b]|uniref:TetR/AcrR family transcriptional regulator n=1 Tax=Winslowiella arboricola TaxID=2978220 RepID=A0A9J6PNF1_9GAMM|nr:TetR/AcrR family transcriptional regulator [Winslowiella arboricola]MCU5774383.1 TetR/AcrR family transcriptional regulator [Winslowiella arboricola]MCU5778930.1 TetR/AcrR family transcriptional regulator [Winslowiella arboricola]